MADNVIAVVLAGWLVLSIANQFDLFSSGISRFDPFKLIPRWTFFAPSPGVCDYHLLFRDRAPDSDAAQWREVELSGSTLVVPMIWNPGRRLTKVVSDVVAIILTQNGKVERFHTMLPITVEYLLLLNLVMKSSALAEGHTRQFALVQSHGFSGTSRESSVILISKYHGS